MDWCNPYSLAASQDNIYGPEPYDVNFCFKIIPESLENERVRLTPFIPKTHGQTLFDNIQKYPDLYHYLPFTPPQSLEDLLKMLEIGFRRDPGFVLFTIWDKTRDDAYAGVIGLIHTSATQSQTEIGYVIVFPPFQRTHVTSNATGLLLKYCLQLPTATPPGLGLRRVEWRANVLNKRSVAAAERMGMRLEGVLRWNWVLPEGKEGNSPRIDDPVKGTGRDSAVLAMCWDDWESGGRDHVEAGMIRKT